MRDLLKWSIIFSIFIGSNYLGMGKQKSTKKQKIGEHHKCVTNHSSLFSTIINLIVFQSYSNFFIKKIFLFLKRKIFLIKKCKAEWIKRLPRVLVEQLVERLVWGKLLLWASLKEGVVFNTYLTWFRYIYIIWFY